MAKIKMCDEVVNVLAFSSTLSSSVIGEKALRGGEDMVERLSISKWGSKVSVERVGMWEIVQQSQINEFYASLYTICLVGNDTIYVFPLPKT